MESLINKSICFYSLFKVRRSWNKGQLLQLQHANSIMSATFMQYRRDARVDNHTHAKRTIIRKKLQAKFKHICIKQNIKYLYTVVITKTGRNSNL